MIREQWFQRLVEASPVDYYSSGVDGARVFWPWRMLKASDEKARGEADKKHGEACDHYVIDSNFQEESVTNSDVFRDAVEYEADVASLADLPGDARATVDAVLDGLELKDDHAFDGTVLVPLQAPHDKCFEAIEASISDRDDVWFGVGGVKDEPAGVKVQASRAVRRVAGDEIHLHGFGFGPTDQLCAELRQHPDLLDSIDNSTAMNRANKLDVLSGEERMSTVSQFANAYRIDFLRKLAGKADDEALEPATTVQSGMGAFACDGGERGSAEKTEQGDK